MAATAVFYVVKYNINSRRKAVPSRREAGAISGAYGTFAGEVERLRATCRFSSSSVKRRQCFAKQTILSARYLVGHKLRGFPSYMHPVTTALGLVCSLQASPCP